MGNEPRAATPGPSCRGPLCHRPARPVVAGAAPGSSGRNRAPIDLRFLVYRSPETRLEASSRDAAASATLPTRGSPGRQHRRLSRNLSASVIRRGKKGAYLLACWSSQMLARRRQFGSIPGRRCTTVATARSVEARWAQAHRLSERVSHRPGGATR